MTHPALTNREALQMVEAAEEMARRMGCKLVPLDQRQVDYEAQRQAHARALGRPYPEVRAGGLKL